MPERHTIEAKPDQAPHIRLLAESQQASGRKERRAKHEGPIVAATEDVLLLQWRVQDDLSAQTAVILGRNNASGQQQDRHVYPLPLTAFRSRQVAAVAIDLKPWSLSPGDRI